MADAPITLRGVASNWNAAANLSVSSHASTAVNDYIVAISLSVYRLSNPGVNVANVSGVTWPGSPIATSVYLNGSTVVAVARAWLGQVTTNGAKSITINSAVQSGDESEQALHVFTLNPGGGTITVDGTPTTQQDQTSPYTHTGITVTGTQDMLICAQSIVQFEGVIDFSVPSGMTQGAEVLPNNFVGTQSLYQMLSASGATGDRTQVSNILDVSVADGGGSAGLMFALRNQVADVGPESGRFLLAY